MLILKWFLSRTVRKAVDLRRHVRKLVNEQRDLLGNEAIASITQSCEELTKTLATTADKEAIKAQMDQLVTVADKCLKPYPHGAARENIKELFVAATVIFGFTTFFFQLTKIPTGSMQPTLYGITDQNLKKEPVVQIPGALKRFALFWTKGVSSCHVTARSDGMLEEVRPPRLVFPFVKIQKLRVGNEWYTVWLPPDRLEERARIKARNGFQSGDTFRKGDDIIRLKVVSGDHLLVDRFTYNFRRPERGEIIVFKTKGISALAQDQLYIKRLVALPGEKVRIGNDQHLIINEQRLDAATPRFENVYTFSSAPCDGCYFGQVNQSVANRISGAYLAPLFQDETQSQMVEPRHYLAMGDNTLNSFDSRAWGGLPQKNVIGKCWFIYWPFTERFGWGTR